MPDEPETPAEPPSGTFLAAQFTHAQPAPEGGWGSGGLSGRAKIIGNSTWMMVGIALVCFTAYVATGFVREDRAEYRRNLSAQIESLERRVDQCERRHTERDVEHARGEQRQFDERRQAADERQRAADERKVTAEQVKRLTDLLDKLSAKLGPD